MGKKQLPSLRTWDFNLLLKLCCHQQANDNGTLYLDATTSSGRSEFEIQRALGQFPTPRHKYRYTSTDTQVELEMADDSLLLGGSRLSADGLLSAIRRVRTQEALPLCPIFTPRQISRFSPFNSSSISTVFHQYLSFYLFVFVRMSEIILQDCCMLLRHWKRKTLSLT